MLGFPGGSDGKESTCNARDAGDVGSIPGGDTGDVGKIPWRRAWHCTTVFLPGESPWTEEPGGLQSVGSQRVGHNQGCMRTHTHTHNNNSNDFIDIPV